VECVVSRRLTILMRESEKLHAGPWKAQNLISSGIASAMHSKNRLLALPAAGCGSHGVCEDLIAVTAGGSIQFQRSARRLQIVVG
jgi:hypothetical protein